MKLVEFVEKYVSHNDVVYLYNKHKVPDPEDDKVMIWEWDLLWKGMDWQIAIGPGEEEYFKVHPEVEKCPYRDNEVISICPAIDGFRDCTDEVGIVIAVIDDLVEPIETKPAYNVSKISSNGPVCVVCGEPMDETYRGSMMCWSCEQKVKEYSE
mgnify:CR=1 FL=1